MMISSWFRFKSRLRLLYDGLPRPSKAMTSTLLISTLSTASEGRRTTFKTKPRLPVLITLILVSASGCQPSGDAPTTVEPETSAHSHAEDFTTLTYSAKATSHHDSRGRVKVEVSSAWSDEGRLVVRATFTPDDSGYHLYSSTLPKKGLDGLGRPTLIEVVHPEEFSDIGPVVSDKDAIELVDEVLNTTFPVYPDGTVTLYLPLRFQAPPQVASPVPLALTYMSCSETNCHMPVERAIVEITPPDPN